MASAKAKVEERLDRAVNESKPTKNRSPELVPLLAEWEKVRRNLRSLVATVKKYHDTTRALDDSRDELAQQFATMAHGTPLHQDLGQNLDSATSEALTRMSAEAAPSDAAIQLMKKVQADVDADTEGAMSLAAIQRFGRAQADSNAKEYQQHVLQWAVEWEQTATERVDNLLTTVRKLQADRDHYEKKVELLRQRANHLEAKGKTSPQRQVDKLDRNEKKLKEAFVLHETEAGRLCTLIEACTRGGWIELYSLARNYLKWESNRVGRETDVYSLLAFTLDSMKATFKKNTPKQRDQLAGKGNGKVVGKKGNKKPKQNAA